MSTAALTARRISRRTARSTADLGPLLVSELPPALPARASLLARMMVDLSARREVRSFERAIRDVGHNEYGDLLAARRRD